MIWQVLALSMVAIAASLDFVPKTRSVFKSGDTGTANLVEFNLKGVTYGRCSFRHQGEDITAIYEERGDQLIARTQNPTVVDPVAKARACRQLAGSNIQSVDSRSDLGELPQESELELMTRLKELESKISENHNYVSLLNSRFFSSLSSFFPSTSSNTYAIGFGNTNFTGLGVSDFSSSSSSGDISLGYFPWKWWGK